MLLPHQFLHVVGPSHDKHSVTTCTIDVDAALLHHNRDIFLLHSFLWTDEYSPHKQINVAALLYVKVAASFHVKTA